MGLFIANHFPVAPFLRADIMYYVRECGEFAFDCFGGDIRLFRFARLEVKCYFDGIDSCFDVYRSTRCFLPMFEFAKPVAEIL